MEWFYNEYAETTRQQFNSMETANRWGLYVKTGCKNFYVYPNSLLSYEGN